MTNPTPQPVWVLTNASTYCGVFSSRKKAKKRAELWHKNKSTLEVLWVKYEEGCWHLSDNISSYCVKKVVPL